MKILFLGYNSTQTKLITHLQSEGHMITHDSDKIDVKYVSNFDFVISFGYRHIIKPDVIKKCGGKLINLHISLLPYNRGSHPNFWSFYDNTPSGVTIHLIDKGIDTGDILLQKEIHFDTNTETFSSTYKKLTSQIEDLFIKNLDRILNCEIIPKKQVGSGTYHKKSDFHGIKSWNTNIKRYLEASKRSDIDINEDELIKKNDIK